MRGGMRQPAKRIGRNSPSSKSKRPSGTLSGPSRSTTKPDVEATTKDGRQCAVCGTDIAHRRADAKTCSAAHRVELSVREKRRVAAQEKREIELSEARTRRAVENGLNRKFVIRWAFTNEAPQVKMVDHDET